MNTSKMSPSIPVDRPLAASSALQHLWRSAGLGEQALQRVELSGAEPVLPSSFAVGTAAQASIAAAALAATELGRVRNSAAQRVSVDMQHAARECCTYFTIDGRVLPAWDKLSGLYPCGDDDGRAGWVRIYANFAHHRDGALRLLGLREGDATERADVTRALRAWCALDFEQAAADAGLVVAALMHGGSQPTDISLIHRRGSGLVSHHPGPLGNAAKQDRHPPTPDPAPGGGAVLAAGRARGPGAQSTAWPEPCSLG